MPEPMPTDIQTMMMESPEHGMLLGLLMTLLVRLGVGEDQVITRMEAEHSMDNYLLRVAFDEGTARVAVVPNPNAQKMN